MHVLLGWNKSCATTRDQIQRWESSRRLADIGGWPERERCQALAELRDPSVGVGLVQYSIPFITAHLSDVSLYPIPFQSATIRIKDQLDMFNQRVAHLQKLHYMTFDASLTELNRSIVISNLEKGYRELADQSAFIVDAISTLANPE